MKLVTFRFPGVGASTASRLGALLSNGERVLDFAASIDAEPARFLEWFDLEGEWFRRACSAYEAADSLGTGAIVRADEVRLLAPVPRPSKVICIGLNYRDHAAESNLPIPKSPIVFSKFPTSVVGPDDAVVLPSTSTQVDYEAELAVVIGRRAKHVSREHALDVVLGYTNFNDVSARDFQFGDGQWQRGKSCDTFAPTGPFIATSDEVRDPHKLTIAFRLNGKTMQSSSTDQLIFGVPELIAFITETITLEPGDLIATGTPPGVGFARKPPVFIQHDDMLEVEIEGLGTLRNRAQSGFSDL
jgi:2-keto-4-pentenoate hydratase/2-oxohepta-3-ene-1,7-dioic acid hydratase in catechol pathway